MILGGRRVPSDNRWRLATPSSVGPPVERAFNRWTKYVSFTPLRWCQVNEALGTRGDPSRVRGMTAIVLERHDQLDLATYCRIAVSREPVAIAPALLRAVQSGRDALTAYLDSGASAYGVSTGLGYLADRPVEAVDQASFQRSILAGRAAGTGPGLSEPVVRGAMLLRLTGFLSGHAGVTPGLCRFIAERLNDGWYPVVPAAVSGAAGEIVPLAHLFGTFVGDGLVRVDGQAVGAGDVLAGRGIAPYETRRQGGDRADQRRSARAGARRSAGAASAGTARARDARGRSDHRRHRRVRAALCRASRRVEGRSRPVGRASPAERTPVGRRAPSSRRARRRSRCE